MASGNEAAVADGDVRRALIRLIKALETAEIFYTEQEFMNSGQSNLLRICRKLLAAKRRNDVSA
jgi:hypothetical protein